MATAKITPPGAEEKKQVPPQPSSPLSNALIPNSASGRGQDKTTPNKKRAKEKYPRLYSLDVYRGLIMVALAFNGFGLYATAKNHLEADPDSKVWQAIEFHFHHVDWAGCAFWDLIQPSFMFMVGASMAYSYAKRSSMGHNWFRMFGHALWRSLALILLGVFLSSNGRDQTNWSFMNVLSQIGLGYSFLFLFWRFPWKVQAFGAILILAWTWAIYFFAPNTGIDLEAGNPEVGVTAEWAQEHLEGIAPAWHKNANVGQDIDLQLLNQFPRKEPFTFNRGGYQTINFLPSLATMLFGLMCGELLRSACSERRKFWTLIVAGGIALIVGQNLHLGFNGNLPMVKRIWTPTWCIFSTGWCCLILGALYGIVDILKWRWAFFPLVVVGVNSLLMYFMGQLLKPWTKGFLETHFSGVRYYLTRDAMKPYYDTEALDQFCTINAPFIQYTLIGCCFWLVCYYLYRQKIFLRI